jgi:hypothetical protein
LPFREVKYRWDSQWSGTQIGQSIGNLIIDMSQLRYRWHSMISLSRRDSERCWQPITPNSWEEHVQWTLEKWQLDCNLWNTLRMDHAGDQ